MQPRISMSLTGAGKSWFAHLFSRSAGIDPYATAVSDVYQDLFDKGSFTGKGIYDVDAFQRAVGQEFPDNHILSHDLIEGNYCRCGLACDIELIDHFPSRYDSYALREHRWVRGDWQILSWMLARVPGTDGTTKPNPLPVVERWKIFDNLRRSLVPPALLLMLLLGWSSGGWPAVLATVGVGLVVALPLLIMVLTLPSSAASSRKLGGDLAATAGQVLLAMVFLPIQAFNMLDAIGRTLWRLLVSHQHLLEWETSAATERRLGTGLIHFCREMWSAPIAAIALAIGLGIWQLDALYLAGPFLIGWLLAPFIAFWISLPVQAKEDALVDGDRRRLLSLARKTWSFFETYVGNDDNWLPPDNYQEDPKNQVAHRTSPTNIGLYLLSAVTAHDFGYVSLPVLLERLEKAFVSLERLEQVHGHFLNWYDTQNLQPLQPRYISTVDSGNLLACFLTLQHALNDKAIEPFPLASIVQGLRTGADLVVESFRALEPPHHPTASRTIGRIESLLADLDRHLQEAMPSPTGGERERGKEATVSLVAFQSWLERLGVLASDLSNDLQHFATLIRESPRELLGWTTALWQQIRDQTFEVVQRAPWLALLREAPANLKEPTAIGSEMLSHWQAVYDKLCRP